ncbi:MAG TPA: ABC transporter permease [Chloroflexota bacterium]
MQRYILTRLVQAVPLLLLITVIVFSLTLLLPGGPLAEFASEPSVSPADLQQLRQYYGLDEPAPVRYLQWLGAILHGDFGNSSASHQPVSTLIAERLPNTLLLQGIALIVTLALAVPLGLLAAVRQHSWVDYVATLLSSVGHAIPTFWSGLLAIIFFSVQFHAWGLPALPATGMVTLGSSGGSLPDRMAHLVLPVAVLALFNASQYTRFVRTSMLDVLGQDYLRTARAKGLAERALIVRHALRTAALPVVTLLALEIPTLFSGAVVVETIFAWPGMGRLFLDSAVRFDYPVLLGLVTIVSVLVIFTALVCDLVYAWLDPRILLR